MIRALLTDFGGVLVRTRTDATRRALEARLGLPPGTIEDRVFGSDASLQAQCGRMTVDEFWEHVRCDLRLDGRLSVAQFRAAFFAEDFLDEELMALIRAARPALKTGLISNAWSNARLLFRDDFAIADAFDIMVISAEEGVMKPEARIYQVALDRLEVPAAQAVFVDDVPANVRGAQVLGITGIKFQTSEQVQREIRRLLARGA